ncbi:MAG: LysM peptidoglycan-binding domain-containing protein, partial [Deltaproteobacteria bacterium]|nr:LysM peptidoglycan-binding domain-containing protein [Deltaproteobacteria bacterium]
MVLVLSALLTACGGQGVQNSAMGREAGRVAQEGRSSEKYYQLGPQFEKQLDEMVGQEYMALSGRKEDVPLELNQDVLVNLNYFLNDARGFMIRSLSRGQKYIPMMKAILRQKGLPEDLVYLALIESGFRTEAVSSASAVGPWQFIAATGRRYGLVIDEWVDERMDPVKSTYAAADYLIALHDMFNSWPLAIAAYNSGEGKILKGMRNPDVDNYWDMAKAGNFLAAETKRYVPSFLAAAIISKDPLAYGLEIEPTPPDLWEEVVVPDPVDLKLAADLSRTSVDRLKELNPHLKKMATPPEPNFVLRVPEGARTGFYRLYAQLPEARRSTQLIVHTAKRGETVEQVAGRYGLTAEVLRQYNDLEGSKLSRGQQLVLPASMPPALTTAAAVQAQGQAPARTETRTSGSRQAVQFPSTEPPPASSAAPPEVPAVRTARVSRSAQAVIQTINHRVRSGETILGIAGLYGVKAEQLKADNKLSSNAIREGQILTIRSNLPLTAAAPRRPRDTWVQVSEGAPIYHSVKSGETVSSIAAQHRLTQRQLMALNDLSGSAIKAGQKLRVGTGPAPAAAGLYEVKAGDTVGLVAARFGLKTDELKRLNNLSGDNIRVGQKLVVSSGTQADGRPGGQPPVASSVLNVYEVQSGDTLGVLAERFNLKTDELRALNDLKTDRLRVGQKLRVPGGAARSATPDEALAAQSAAARSEAAEVFYEVQPGDSVSVVAERFGLKSDELRRLNNLTGDRIRVGQKLNVGSGRPAEAAAAAPQDARTTRTAQASEPAAAGTSAAGTAASGLYEVQPGDSVSVVAERFGLKSDELRRLNKLTGDRIRVGQKLNVGSGRPVEAAASQDARTAQAAQTAEPAAETSAAGTAASGLYEVQPGDSVSVIAERFGLKSDELRRLNNLTGDRIRVGQMLNV